MEQWQFRPDQILSYFRLEWTWLVGVTVTGILYNVGMGAGPYFEGRLAQRLYEILEGSRQATEMLGLAMVYVFVIFVVQTSRAGKRYTVRVFANQVSRLMRHTLYHGMVYRHIEAGEQEKLGSYMTKAIGDVDACAEGMRKFTTELFDTGVVMAVYIAMLLYFDWRLTILACLFTPVAYMLADRLKKQVVRANGSYKECEAQLNEKTMDRISRALTYRIFGREQNRDKAYEEQLEEYEKASSQANIFEGSMGPLYDAISMAGTVLIFYFGSRNVQGTGWTQWDIASFTTFLACFIKLAVKTSHAAKLFNAVQKAQVSWQRIKPLLTYAAGVENRKELAPINQVALHVQHLSCRYKGQVKGLEDLSFTAEPGEIIGITGKVACGKSLLGKVFLDEVCWEGVVRLNNRKLEDLSEAECRSMISYMGHNPELITGSIRENITLGDSVEVDKWLKAVCLDREVAALPEGSDTSVGTGGAQLSGGQKARVALARTLSHSKGLVILDDPFAGLDADMEQIILQQIRSLLPDRTILLISHQLVHFPEFDHVLFLKDDKGIFSTHQELLAQEPEYRALYESQQKEVDLDAK